DLGTADGKDGRLRTPLHREDPSYFFDNAGEHYAPSLCTLPVIMRSGPNCLVCTRTSRRPWSGWAAPTPPTDVGAFSPPMIRGAIKVVTLSTRSKSKRAPASVGPASTKMLPMP